MQEIGIGFVLILISGYLVFSGAQRGPIKEVLRQIGIGLIFGVILGYLVVNGL
ncbi:MAG: hypothetical protein ACE5JP_03490 [Candidatus Bipolaricaulia bacterium]